MNSNIKLLLKNIVNHNGHCTTLKCSICPMSPCSGTISDAYKEANKLLAEQSLIDRIKDDIINFSDLL